MQRLVCCVAKCCTAVAVGFVMPSVAQTAAAGAINFVMYACTCGTRFICLGWLIGSSSDWLLCWIVTRHTANPLVGYWCWYWRSVFLRNYNTIHCALLCLLPPPLSVFFRFLLPSLSIIRTYRKKKKSKLQRIDLTVLLCALTQAGAREDIHRKMSTRVHNEWGDNTHTHAPRCDTTHSFSR